MFRNCAQEDREAVAPVIVRLLGAQSEACPPGAAAAQPGPRVGGVPAAVRAQPRPVHCAAHACAGTLLGLSFACPSTHHFMVALAPGPGQGGGLQCSWRGRI